MLRITLLAAMAGRCVGQDKEQVIFDANDTDQDIGIYLTKTKCLDNPKENYATWWRFDGELDWSRCKCSKGTALKGNYFGGVDVSASGCMKKVDDNTTVALIRLWGRSLTCEGSPWISSSTDDEESKALLNGTCGAMVTSSLPYGYAKFEAKVPIGCPCDDLDKYLEEGFPDAPPTPPPQAGPKEPDPNGPPPKETIELECVSDNLPYQIFTTGDAMEMASWDWATGDREAYWTLKKVDYPEISFINGCGIGPWDNKAYCVVSYRGTGYLARVDKDGFAYVAKTPGGQTSFTATFDETGKFWAARGDKLWFIEDVNLEPGYAEPTKAGWEPGLPEMTEVPDKTSVTHGADLAVLQNIMVSINRRDVVMTNLSDPNLRTWKPKADPPFDLPNDNYGGAYYYSGSIFFSANSGAGVFEIIPNFEAETYEVVRIGQSFESGNNDGLNCLFTERPPGIENGGKFDAAERTAVQLGAPLAVAAAAMWSSL